MKAFALSVVLAAMLAAVLPAAPANALFFTYVSRGGSDANNCDLPTPCLTMGRAIMQTTSGGTAHCLDGNDYTQTVTIAISMEVDCRGTGAGAGPFVINGAGVTVSIRGVLIFVNGSPGISFTNGAALFVEDTIIRNNPNGILFAPSTGTAQLGVLNTTIYSNGSGSSGAGINIQPTGSGNARAVINRVTVEKNVQGIVADTTTTSGSIVVQVLDSVVSGHSGNGIWAKGTAGVVVDRTSSKNNAGYGILSDGPGAVIILGNSSVIGNGGGLGVASGGSIQSYQNNQTKGNGFDGAPTSVLSLN